MKRVNLQFHHCFHLYYVSNQFVSYCSAFPAPQGCNKMCFNEYGPRNTPTLHDFWASANLGVYKLTGAILIGGVRWHQTFPRWGGPRVGWFELSRILPVPVGPPTVSQWGGLRVGWFELSWILPVACGTSYCQSVGVLLRRSSSVPLLVLCFVPNVSLLRRSSSAHGWDKHGYNGSFFGSCQGVSLWSLKLSGYCATAWWHTVSVCELAACASALFYWRLLKWSLLVSSGKFLFPSSVVPSIGLHLLWDANYCICAAEPYGPMVTWCCMYLSSNWQTWLILPVVICLSQRLSHACLSISFYTAKLRMAH